MADTTTNQDLALQAALKLGITQEQYNQMDSTQRALIGIVGNIATTTYSTSGSGMTLGEAFVAANKDPNIIAKYSDALKLDTQQLKQSLEQAQIATSTEAEQRQMQFDNAKNQADEAAAAAGTAYSGFRGKAQEQLKSTETGIIESSRSAAKKTVNDLTTAFESKYGTAATTRSQLTYKNPITGIMEPILGQLAGTTNTPITGTVAPQKSSDILSKTQDFYSTAQLPKL